MQHLRGSTVAVALGVFLSCGIASPLWFWYRAASLNQLAEQLEWRVTRPHVSAAHAVFTVCSAVIPAILFPETGWDVLISAAGGAVFSWQALDTSRIVRRTGALHGVRVSGWVSALLPWLTPIYFQHKLNALADTAAANVANRDRWSATRSADFE